MDDGSSPVSILLLMGFILLEAVFYGFGAAIQNVNEGKLDAFKLLHCVFVELRKLHLCLDSAS